MIATLGRWGKEEEIFKVILNYTRVCFAHEPVLNRGGKKRPSEYR